MGTYNAQITSAAFTSVINTVNASAAAAGSTGSTGTTRSTGTTGSTTTALPGGFGSNPASIAGNTPAVSRFYFDGAGNILGAANGNGAFLRAAGT